VSATEHEYGTQLQETVSDFNVGDDSATLDSFASDVTFVVPGRSALAGTYHGRAELGRFFGQLHELSGGTFKAQVEEVLANDNRMVLFLRFTAQRGEERLNVLMAGFHDDRGPDGWRKASFLVDDLTGFDRLFRPT
jgi:hypothetical protein